LITDFSVIKAGIDTSPWQDQKRVPLMTIEAG
jgi:hypothetical protein